MIYAKNVDVTNTESKATKNIKSKSERGGMKRLIDARGNVLYLSLLLLFLNACGGPSRYKVGYREVGLASWYGNPFHGRQTASGEIYDMHGLSAAHKTLPLGTRLRVTDPKSGRSVKVKVNDRGPFVGRRILDLSLGAAKELGIVTAGVAKVKIEIIGHVPIVRGRQRAKHGFLVQVASYERRENALRMKRVVARHYKRVYLEVAETIRGRRYRVRLGPYRSKKAAQSIARGLPSHIMVEGIDPIVVRAD